MSPGRSRKMRTKDKRMFAPLTRSTSNSAFALGSVPAFPGTCARDLANIRSCPTGYVHYEPMFVQKEKKSSRVMTRAADAVDLIIEFATLGEYGLEYPEPVRSGSRRMNRSSGHGEGRADRGTGQRHRHGRRPCRPGRTRVDLPGWGDRPGHEIPGTQPGRRHRATSALPEALCPPRIRLEVA